MELSDVTRLMQSPFYSSHAKLKKMYEHDLAESLPLTGISSSDKEAIQKLQKLIKELKDKSLIFQPQKDSGTFYVRINQTSEPIAVFKIGRKRARMEILCRAVAHEIGLGDKIIPGAFYSTEMIQEMPKSKEAVSEELWNGNVKVYLSNNVRQKTQRKVSKPLEEARYTSESDDESSEDFFERDDEFLDLSEDKFEPENHDSWLEQHANVLLDPFKQDEKGELPLSPRLEKKNIVGILEPFLSSESLSSEKTLSYAKMVMVSLALGLRDGKSDGHVNHRLIDVEDVFPSSFEPIKVKGRQLAPTHLPFLAEKESESTISLQGVAELHEIVSKWDVEAIERKFTHEQIYFSDGEVEAMSPKSIGDDEGGFKCKVDKIADSTFLSRKRALDNNVLNPKQIHAFKSRLGAIKQFVESRFSTKETFTPLDMVFAVDECYRNQYTNFFGGKSDNKENPRDAAARQAIFMKLGKMPL